MAFKIPGQSRCHLGDVEGINKGDLDVIETPEQAKTMYEALLPLISAYDVDNI